MSPPFSGPAVAEPLAAQSIEQAMNIVPRRNVKPRRQVDSGIRLAGGPLGAHAAELDDLPPAYSDLASTH